jgi:hypothetical protein
MNRLHRLQQQLPHWNWVEKHTEAVKFLNIYLRVGNWLKKGNSVPSVGDSIVREAMT